MKHLLLIGSAALVFCVPVLQGQTDSANVSNSFLADILSTTPLPHTPEEKPAVRIALAPPGSVSPENFHETLTIPREENETAFMDQEIKIDKSKKMVAIFPFHFASTDADDVKMLESLNGLLYDLFAGQLTGTFNFSVVDRRHIASLYEEIKFQHNGINQNQVVEFGKTQGAELALFGTVTHVFRQTFLTLKIIDIESSIILKAIHVKGDLKHPDVLASEAGQQFMAGLNQVLSSRYSANSEFQYDISSKGIGYFFKARDYFNQAIIAKQNGNTEQFDKFKRNCEKYLESALKEDSKLKITIQNYRDRNLSQLEEPTPY